MRLRHWPIDSGNHLLPLPAPRWVATVAPVREHGGRHSHRSRGDQKTRQQQQQPPTLPASTRFPPKSGEGTIVATPSPPLPLRGRGLAGPGQSRWVRVRFSFPPPQDGGGREALWRHSGKTTGKVVRGEGETGGRAFPPHPPPPRLGSATAATPDRVYRERAQALNGRGIDAPW